MAGMQIRNRKAFYPVIYRRSSDVSYIKKKEFIQMQEEKKVKIEFILRSLILFT